MLLPEFKKTSVSGFLPIYFINFFFVNECVGLLYILLKIIKGPRF